MTILNQVRLMGATAILCSVPALAMAQTQSPPTTSPTTPPAAKPEPAPMPQPGPAARPSDASKAPAVTPQSTDKSATAPKENPLVGIAVFSSDGSRLGTVHSVTEDNGKVSSIRIKSGGFLGFGGKLVAIPEGKFIKTGDNIQLALTADEVSKLPEVKDNS